MGIPNCSSSEETVAVDAPGWKARLIVMPLLAIAAVSSLSCTRTQTVEPAIPASWTRIEADRFFTFYLPEGMRLVSEERCQECAWGSSYSNDRLRLYAEYTSWNEEFAPQYLAKQTDYVKEITDIDKKPAKIQHWLLAEPVDGYKFTVDARIYNPKDRRLIARMSTLCKDAGDMETAKQIVKTMRFQ